MEKEFWEGLSIHRQPCRSLSDCLRSGGDLKELAMDMGLLGRKEEDEEPDQDALVAAVAEELPKRLERDFPYFGEEHAHMIAMAVSAMEDNRPIAEGLTWSFHVMAGRGYLYLYDWEDSFWLAFPEELLAVWKRLEAEEEATAAQRRNQELSRYANALANLYGVYEIRQFAAVWNQHHRDKITAEDAEEILLRAEDFTGDFWLYDGYVASEAVWDDEFDEILEATEDMPYYMPAKSVITAYADDGRYDRMTPELERILAFFDRVLPGDAPRREDLDFEIVMSCEHSYDGGQLADLLSGHSFPFDDPAAVEEFGRLYRSLRNNTRQWLLRGDTPGNHSREHGGALPSWELPAMSAKKTPKVGRNALCPCGSGKKYKRCCGR